MEKATREQDSKTSPCPGWLLEFVCCPVSLLPLVPATQELLERLNELHHLNPLCTHNGRTISGVPTQGLVSQDGCWLYPVQDQIPTLIPDEAISIAIAKTPKP